MKPHLQGAIMRHLDEVREGYCRSISREIDYDSGPVSVALQSLLGKGYVEQHHTEPQPHGGNPLKWYRLTELGRQHVKDFPSDD